MDRHLTRGCMMPVPTHANLYQYLVNKHSQLPEILRQSEACTGDSAANPCYHFTAVCILMSSAPTLTQHYLPSVPRPRPRCIQS